MFSSAFKQSDMQLTESEVLTVKRESTYEELMSEHSCVDKRLQISHRCM